MSKTVGAIAFLLIIAGCTAPLMNVNDEPITGSHTQQEVRQAIVAGGASRGWVMQDAGPGMMRGSLHVRTHTAEIEVAYTSTSYSITYVSSTDLQYNNGMIHHNYNRWVANLSEAIQGILNLAT